MKEVLLVTTSDASETAMALDVLAQKNIPVRTQAKGVGAWIAAYVGDSINGDDIYVGESDFEAAKAAIAGMF